MPSHPDKTVIIDEGHIFRSVFSAEQLYKEIARQHRESLVAGEGAFTSTDEFPIVTSAGLWAKKKPRYDNITEYEFWKNDRERFEALCDEFGIQVHGGGGA